MENWQNPKLDFVVNDEQDVSEVLQYKVEAAQQFYSQSEQIQCELDETEDLESILTKIDTFSFFAHAMHTFQNQDSQTCKRLISSLSKEESNLFHSILKEGEKRIQQHK